MTLPSEAIGNDDRRSREGARFGFGWLLVLVVSLAVHIVLWLWLVGSQDGPADIASVSGHDPAHFPPPAIINRKMGPEFAALFAPFLLGLSTNLGIAASILWEQSRSGRGAFAFRDLAPFLVSPVILLFTYSAAVAHPDPVVATLMAFENGFFWQSIFGRAKRKAKGSPR